MNLREQKREARREYVEPKKELQRLKLRCFWTWPFGHVWVPDGITPSGMPLSRCAVCRCRGVNRH